MDNWPKTDDDIQAWMDAHRAKRHVRELGARVEKSRRRKAKRVLVEHEVIDNLLSMLVH